MVNLSQDTTNGSKLAPQPDEGSDSKYSTATEGGDSKYSTANEGGDSKSSTASNSGPLNEMPPDGYLLEKEPGAGGAPPDGAYLERLANKDQVNTTEDGNTLHKVAS